MGEQSQQPRPPEGDWLAEAVKYAHESGIELHPYVNNCVVEGRTSPETLAQLRAAGRLQEDPDGKLLARYDLSKLEALFLAGERLDPDTYHWASEKLGIPVMKFDGGA